MKISESKLRQIIKEELDDHMTNVLVSLYLGDEEQREQAKEILLSLDDEDRKSFMIAIEPWRALLPDDKVLDKPEDLFKMRLVDTSKSSHTEGSWVGTKWRGGGTLLKRTFDIELNGQKIGTFVNDGGKTSEVEIFGKKKKIGLDYSQSDFDDKKFKGYVIYQPRPKGKNNKRNTSIERSGLMAYGGIMRFLKTKGGQKWFRNSSTKKAIEGYKTIEV
jgi:hypothetical protein